jgi:hypothetical protein
MLGALIDSVEDPKLAARLLDELHAPDLTRRLEAVAQRTGVSVAEAMASTLRHFMETADDDHWVQLIGIMNRAEDPGLAAIRAILMKALPQAGPEALAASA